MVTNKQRILIICKKITAVFCVLFLIFLGYVVISVHIWSVTDEGRLPPKTAVILHAVNHQIITTDMTPPQFLTKPRPATIARETISILASDGEEISARVYYPINGGPHPVILFYHGGAFMEGYGNVETHDNIVRALAVRTQSVVIAVSYRLAPRYVFPTAVNDSYETLVWAYNHASKFNGNPNKIAVVGDSAGGNLATATALMARDLKGPKLEAQALLYPLTTFQDIPLESRTIYDSGYYLLSRGVMLRARELYTPQEEMWANPYTSPLNADNLTGLPQTLIITAEYDPLQDEGTQYGEKLASFGVPVKHLHYEGVMHGFVSFYEVMQVGEHGLRETVNFLNKAFQRDQEQLPSYEIVTIETSKGIAKLREYIEAYAVAAFLIITDWRK